MNTKTMSEKLTFSDWFDDLIKEMSDGFKMGQRSRTEDYAFKREEFMSRNERVRELIMSIEAVNAINATQKCVIGKKMGLDKDSALFYLTGKLCECFDDPKPMAEDDPHAHIMKAEYY